MKSSTPKFTEKEFRDMAKLFFENWAHLKYMADNLGRIATVLEVMDARVKSGFTVVA
mgnify:CR=1 FL=1